MFFITYICMQKYYQPYTDETGYLAIVSDKGKSIGAGSKDGLHTTEWLWDGILPPQGTPIYIRCINR